jgi:hypothetical protein
MNVQFQPNFRTAERRLPFECVALVLQGGGALGAYQAGVYEALAEANINPDWVAGVSIGAINSAIIAGNETSERVAKLRTFWQEITTNPLLDWAAAAHTVAPNHRQFRLFRQRNAYDPTRARDGKRIASAQLSSRRDRGRILLGWRPHLEHSAAVGGRARPPPRHAGLSGGSLERARRASWQFGGRRDAPEGNTILKSHARQHQSVQAVPARPKNARESSLETTS